MTDKQFNLPSTLSPDVSFYQVTMDARLHINALEIQALCWRMIDCFDFDDGQVYHLSFIKGDPMDLSSFGLIAPPDQNPTLSTEKRFQITSLLGPKKEGSASRNDDHVCTFKSVLTMAPNYLFKQKDFCLKNHNELLSWIKLALTEFLTVNKTMMTKFVSKDPKIWSDFQNELTVALAQRNKQDLQKKLDQDPSIKNKSKSKAKKI